MTDHPETEIQFIRRIMAMLLSLACLAERAAGYPYPIRAFLLWVLRRAEKAAQDFVDVEDLWAGASHGNGRDDALDLADSLRELAAFLRDDLEQENLFQGWWRNGGFAGGGEVADVHEPGDRGFTLSDRIAGIADRLAWMAGFAPIPRLDSS